jgi:hypothetical protein
MEGLSQNRYWSFLLCLERLNILDDYWAGSYLDLSEKHFECTESYDFELFFLRVWSVHI